jgi:hypothetical protein
MRLRALQAANTAAQEIRALHAGVSKQLQQVNQDTKQLVQRLDVRGHGQRIREMHMQKAMAALDAETARHKSLINAVAAVATTVGTVVTAAIAAGQRLLDREQGRLNVAEEGRIEEEAGRKGGARLAMAEFRLEEAQRRADHVQQQIRDKETRSWLPGPSFLDRQRLEGALADVAARQQAVYDAGGDGDVRPGEDRLPPHQRGGAGDVPKQPGAGADRPAAQSQAGAGAAGTPTPTEPDRPLTPAEAAEKYPFEDEAFMQEAWERRRREAAAESPPDTAPPSTLPAPAGKHGEAADSSCGAEGRSAHAAIPPVAATVADLPATPPAEAPTAAAPGQPDALAGQVPAASAGESAGQGPVVRPAQPDVTGGDGPMPTEPVIGDAEAAKRWGKGAAQPLPLTGTPAERLHGLMDAARQGALTRDMILANKDLFTPAGLTRLQAGFLADMGAAHNGRAGGVSFTRAELQRTLDQALGFGRQGPLSPAMRQAMLPRAAANLLDAVGALHADASDANRQAYQQARRDYEDLKHGDLMDDGRLQVTGVLHLLGAEIKEALEPVTSIDAETGKLQGDLTAQLFGAVGTARSLAEAALREGRAAKEYEALERRIGREAEQVEQEGAMYGVGPQSGVGPQKG